MVDISKVMNTSSFGRPGTRPSTLSSIPFSRNHIYYQLSIEYRVQPAFRIQNEDVSMSEEKHTVNEI